MDFEIKDNVLIKYSGADKNINVPEGVTVVDKCAFAGSDVISVKFPSSVKELKDNVFASCSSLKSVSFSYGIEKIGENVFMNCINLTEARIPASVMSIGENAFDGCEDVVIYGEARCYVDEYAAEKELGFDPGETY